MGKFSIKLFDKDAQQYPVLFFIGCYII